jgi:hypothetical protein
MDVNSMGQVPSVAAAASGPATSEKAAAAEVARQAWFDLNGDGRISDRGTMYGGDAYLTWPPPGGVDQTPSVRPVARPSGPDPEAPARVETELRHARELYASNGPQVSYGPEVSDSAA